MNGFMRVPFTSSPCRMSFDRGTAQSPKPAGTTIGASHHSGSAAASKTSGRYAHRPDRASHSQPSFT